MTGAEIAAASGLLAIGAVVQGSVGFGMNALAAPLIVLIDVDFVPGPLLIAALVMTIGVALDHRRAVDWPAVGWGMVGRVPGVVLGALAVGAWSDDALAIVVAVVVLGSVLVSIVAPPVPLRSTTLVAGGLGSGFGGTTTSIGGPPMSLVLQREPPDMLRGTLSTFLTIGILLAIGALTLAGEMDGTAYRTGLALIPGVLVGLVASRRLRPILDRSGLRTAVLAMSSVSAVILLVSVFA